MSGQTQHTALDIFFDEQLITISERPVSVVTDPRIRDAGLNAGTDVVTDVGTDAETGTTEACSTEIRSTETPATTDFAEQRTTHPGDALSRLQASAELADLITRLDLLLRHTQRRRRVTPALQPVHWQTLRYLALCNRFSDTLLALSAWLGATKGTTSQTVSLLERSGLLQRVVDGTDRRVMHLQLTAAGRALLAQSMCDEFLASASEQTGLGDSLHAPLARLLHRWQALLAMPSFGRCGQCRHHARQDDQPYCRRLQTALDEADQQHACFHHEWPSGEPR